MLIGGGRVAENDYDRLVLSFWVLSVLVSAFYSVITAILIVVDKLFVFLSRNNTVTEFSSPHFNSLCDLW